MEIINGIVSGIVLAFLIGPVFFAILQTSIEKGFRSGLFVAIGVSLSDMLYITIAWLGIYQFFQRGNVMEYLAYIGGGVLLLFGVYYTLIKNKKISTYDSEQVQTAKPLRLIMKGFVINGLSPMVLIFWIGAVGVATTKFGYTSTAQALPYFAAIVITVFLTDLLKAKLADRLREVLTPRFIRNMNIAVGILLIVFGVRMIASADHLMSFLINPATHL